MNNDNDFDQDRLDAIRKNLENRGERKPVSIAANLEWKDGIVGGEVVVVPAADGKLSFGTPYMPKP